MLRKIIIGVVALAAIAVTALPTDVSARGRGGWHGSHGWHGGWRGPGLGYGYYRSYGYPYAYANGCYRNVRVATPYGWGWQRVWVCG